MMAHAGGAVVLAGAGLLLFLILATFPSLDLAVSGWFYVPGAGFHLGRLLPLRLIYAAVPILAWGCAAWLTLALVHAALRRPRLWSGRERALAFLLLSLAIGPGLLTNTLLKDHWGRARPSQVTEFGGAAQFTPVLEPTDQCRRNCSFPAGHAAMAFWPLSLLFLTRRPRPRAALVLVGLGLAVGLVRIVQGGHFLSDVVGAGLLTSGVAWLLHRWVVRRDGLATLASGLRRQLPGAEPRARIAGFARRHRVAWPAAGLLLLITLSFVFVDRPLAQQLRGLDPGTVRLFDRITQLGVGTGWLVGSGSLTALLWVASWQSDLRWLRPRIQRWRDAACFFFVAVAASGLLTDALKVVLGRARPRLLFGQDLYGFTWFAGHASDWSMPSGHATTMAAVATALSVLWPRHVAAYMLVAVLVALSRVIITVHYLSDVMLGGAIGITLTLWLARRSGLVRDGG